MTQEQIGEICDVSKGMVSQWESDDGLPSPERLLLLKKRMQFSIDWLLCGEDDKSAENQREAALLKLYRDSDERGRDTIYRVAEQESGYEVSTEYKARKTKKSRKQ